MKKKFYFFISIFLLIIIISCEMPSNNKFNSNPRQGNLFIIEGYIKSINDYSAIQSAEVTVNGTKTFSDANGYFSIEANDRANNDSIKIKKYGYADLQKPLSVFSGNNVQVEFTLKPVDLEIEINPSREEGNKITTLGRASVFIPKLTGIYEPLIVSLTNFDVSTEEINCVPGDFSALDSSGNETTIVSQGMIDVTIKGKYSGNEYSLNGLGNYNIVIPITGDIDNAPDIIPLWYFDENLCKWVEEGTLKKSIEDPDFYEATVTHFSTWNADFKVNTTGIYGIIDDPSTDQTYEIKLIFNGYTISFYENEKNFSIINIPQNTDMDIFVKKSSTGEIWRRAFITNNNPEPLFVGYFPGINALPEVKGLVAVVHYNSVSLIWNYEPGIASNIEISYSLKNSPVINSFIISRGIKTADIFDLSPGLYKITVKTMDAEGNKSYGITKYVRIADSYGVTLYNYTRNNASLIYSYNDNPAFNSYLQPLILPRKTKITIDIDKANKNNYYWYWDGISNYNFPLDFYLEDDDVNISLYIQSGSS